MFLKTLTCACCWLAFILASAVIIEDIVMVGRTDWRRVIFLIIYFVLSIITISIPEEKYWPESQKEIQEKQEQVEVEVFSIHPKIENGDTTYIIKYRTK